MSPTPPVSRKNILRTVITNGVGLTGSVSPTIQNVGLKMRLITASITSEIKKSTLGTMSAAIASLLRGFTIPGLMVLVMLNDNSTLVRSITVN